MEGLSWVLSALGSLFGLLEIAILGVPIYAYLIMVFLFALLAKFLHGRK